MQEPIITTRYGRLRGTIENNIDGGTYLSFKGIPYAKSPVGELRFSNPVPPEPWNGVRDAIEHGDNCAQRDRIMRNTRGSEDCLYLNVYTNFIDVTSKLPVMVWIHGGAFMFGSADSDMFGPDYLLKHEVVVVTINYRLGVLGFLNLEDEICPGNLGFKDQILALKWVRENIKYWGGNPDNITLFGESAGAVSVYFLALSPLSRGLFHKAISQSGVPLNPWAFMPKNPVSYAHRLCEILGEKSKDPKTIIDFLRRADIDELINAQENVLTKKEKHRVLYPFGPGIDLKSEEPFLTSEPSIAVKTLVNVPFLLGFNSLEGALMVAGKTEKDFEVINAMYTEMLHPSTLSLLARKYINSRSLRKYYFGEEDVSIKNTEKYARMCSELYFQHGIIESWKLQAQSPTPTYCYQFSYQEAPTFVKRMFSLEYLPGACHTDEMDYIFHMPIKSLIDLEPAKPDTNEYKLTKRMTKMWTDFSKTGNPTPNTSNLIPLYWRPIECSTLHYLNINENLCMESFPITYDLLDAVDQRVSKL